MTDKNGETELMIEYINNYMNKNKLNGNIIYRNNILDNYNIERNTKNDNNLNKYMNNNDTNLYIF